eukprot:TRINITY_DN1894_c0_g1_i11.p2 TRINITY_DN1894_c0_g1~~TRINITY_DN1894_c0_g1_i11.p2  ORF type:complete len:206 (-),score=4.05 TRINITY_DN1894_c0_g1_i11:32-649(-)
MCIRDSLIGDASVGKSSLLLRYTDNTFSDSYMSTIGVDFKVKSLRVQDKLIKLQIWDTAGQERFKTIIQSYYKGSQGVFLVYDVTDYQSFQNLDNWLYEIQNNSEPNIEKVLIGNKVDLADKRKVSQEVAIEWAEKHGIKYFETSAKSGENVDHIFQILSEDMTSKLPKEAKDISNKRIINGVKIDTQAVKNKNTSKGSKNDGCC